MTSFNAKRNASAAQEASADEGAAVSVRDAEPEEHEAIRVLLEAAYRQFASAIPRAIYEPYIADILDLEPGPGRQPARRRAGGPAAGNDHLLRAGQRPGGRLAAGLGRRPRPGRRPRGARARDRPVADGGVPRSGAAGGRRGAWPPYGGGHDRRGHPVRAHGLPASADVRLRRPRVSPRGGRARVWATGRRARRAREDRAWTCSGSAWSATTRNATRPTSPSAPPSTMPPGVEVGWPRSHGSTPPGSTGPPRTSWTGSTRCGSRRPARTGACAGRSRRSPSPAPTTCRCSAPAVASST